MPALFKRRTPKSMMDKDLDAKFRIITELISVPQRCLTHESFFAGRRCALAPGSAYAKPAVILYSQNQHGFRLPLPAQQVSRPLRRSDGYVALRQRRLH